MEGWADITLFKNGTVDTAAAAAATARTPEEEAADQARLERKVDALYNARKRVLPLGIASGVLGIAIWTFAVGAMAGRRGARRLLVQVVTVHGALAVAAYILTPDVRRVDVAIGHEAEQEKAAELADAGTNNADLEHARVIGDRVVDAAPAIGLTLGLLGHLAIVIALTRRRTLAFYELAGS